MRTLFVGGSIYTPDGILEDGWLLVDDQLIRACGTDQTLPAADKIIHLEQRALLPGFINIHVHGSVGVDTMDADPASIEKMSLFEAAHGVTCFLPTTMTAPQGTILRVIEAVRQAMVNTNGARILGVHLEGPYISPEKPGAQATESISAPDTQAYNELFDSGCVQLITIAPEIKGSLALIRAAHEHDITIAAGHSIATYDQTLAAVAAGLSHVTHLYNGMPGFHHRQPGLLGAALTQDSLSVEVIADLIHVHPAAIEIALKCKPAEKLVLVTDSMRAAGMPDGIYDLGGQAVTVEQGIARLQNGALAGSTLSLDRAINNIMQALSLSLEKTVRLATANAAHVLGLQEHKGTIAAGMDADLVIWNKGIVDLTMVEGSVVYKNPGISAGV